MLVSSPPFRKSAAVHVGRRNGKIYFWNGTRRGIKEKDVRRYAKAGGECSEENPKSGESNKSVVSLFLSRLFLISQLSKIARERRKILRQYLRACRDSVDIDRVYS